MAEKIGSNQIVGNVGLYYAIWIIKKALNLIKLKLPI